MLFLFVLQPNDASTLTSVWPAQMTVCIHVPTTRARGVKTRQAPFSAPRVLLRVRIRASMRDGARDHTLKTALRVAMGELICELDFMRR